MARFSGIFLNTFLFVLLAVQPGIPKARELLQRKRRYGLRCQKARPQQLKGQNAKKNAAESAAKPAPLTPEITHRIITEIRSRYNVPPQVTISLSEPKAGTMAGYDDLVVSFTGGTNTTHHDFLISTDRKTLAHVEKIDISQDLMSKIDVKGRPVKGNPSAKVTIINFDDFQCPFCSRMHSTLFDNVFKDYADKIKVIYKDYPLIEIHPWAMHAAIDGNCLGEQNAPAYWDLPITSMPIRSRWPANRGQTHSRTLIILPRNRRKNISLMRTNCRPACKSRMRPLCAHRWLRAISWALTPRQHCLSMEKGLPARCRKRNCALPWIVLWLIVDSRPRQMQKTSQAL